LVRWVGDTQQAEDCLQQVFLEALRSIENFRGEGKLGSWLNRIATHVVMDMFRQKQRMKALMERVLPQQEAGMLDQPPALPEQLFLREETRLWVRELLEKLSPQKRMAVLLCDLEGMSLEDASQQMGVPTGTVGSRLYHARRELQKRVESELQKRGLGWEDLA
jgi:RNA polymerase sigma-70 factor (ECF subfamily)